MSDDDHFVSNPVGHLTGDLDSPEVYGQTSGSERAATLLWVMDGRIRIDAIGGRIETHGHQTTESRRDEAQGLV